MRRQYCVLICDDDDVLRETLIENICQYDEFRVIGESSGKNAVEFVKKCHVDLVLMDIDLPDITGAEVVGLLRAQGFCAPIIMLSALQSDVDVVAALDSGANDYVTKPFRFAVLVARIRVQLRQYEGQDDAVLQIGPYNFHPGSKVLIKGAIRVKLTEKESAILRYLYRANGNTVSRDILLKEVWGYNVNVATHTIETHIYRLRQKIEDSCSEPCMLLTGDGGYRLEI